MKKLLMIALCLFMFAGASVPAFACKYHRQHSSRAVASRRYAPGYTQAASRRNAYPTRSYYSYGDRRSFWQKHRDKLTLAAGTGGGAILGGLIGGRRGAGIGALAGAGGSALYTYKLRNKHRRY